MGQMNCKPEGSKANDALRGRSGQRVRRACVAIALGVAVGAPVGALTAHAPQFMSALDGQGVAGMASSVPTRVRAIAEIAWQLLRGGESVPVALADAVYRIIPGVTGTADASAAMPSPYLDDADVRLVPELRRAPVAPSVGAGRAQERGAVPKAGGGEESPFVFPMITRLRDAFGGLGMSPQGKASQGQPFASPQAGAWGLGGMAPAIVGGPMFVPLPDDLATLWLTPHTPDSLEARAATAGKGPAAKGSESARSPEREERTPGTTTAPARKITLGFSASPTAGIAGTGAIMIEPRRSLTVGITPGRIVVRRSAPD